MRSGPGIGMIESVPWKSPPMYSRSRPSPPEASGLGPSRLARELVPLPLATRIVLPSRENRTEVGYQPVGMNPSGVLAPGSFTFTAARWFVFALATRRIDSSGERASELGVDPAGAAGSMAVPIVSTGLPAAVSITVTVFRLALAA